MNAVSIPIDNDPRLQSQMLTWLIGRVERGPLEELIQLGFTREFLESLRNMTTAEVERLSMSRFPCVAAAFDPVRIASTMNSMHRSKEMDELLAYWVKHGATSAMLRLKFKLTHADVQQLRKTHGVQDNQGGRPAIPDKESEIEAIVDAWLATASASSDVRRRYQILHQRFGARYSLATLYTVIRQSEIGL